MKGNRINGRWTKRREDKEDESEEEELIKEEWEKLKENRKVWGKEDQKEWKRRKDDGKKR